MATATATQRQIRIVPRDKGILVCYRPCLSTFVDCHIDCHIGNRFKRSTFFHCQLAVEMLGADWRESRVNKEKARKGIRSVKISDERLQLQVQGKRPGSGSRCKFAHRWVEGSALTEAPFFSLASSTPLPRSTSLCLYSISTCAYLRVPVPRTIGYRLHSRDIDGKICFS